MKLESQTQQNEHECCEERAKSRALTISRGSAEAGVEEVDGFWRRSGESSGTGESELGA